MNNECPLCGATVAGDECFCSEEEAPENLFWVWTNFGSLRHQEFLADNQIPKVGDSLVVRTHHQGRGYWREGREPSPGLRIGQIALLVKATYRVCGGDIEWSNGTILEVIGI